MCEKIRIIMGHVKDAIVSEVNKIPLLSELLKLFGVRAIFATVIQKQVAANVLRTVAMNPDVRVNRNQVNATRDEILYELDGAPTGRASGLGYELKQAYKALSFDTRGLDRVCLQCNNHGVKYRTV